MKVLFYVRANHQEIRGGDLVQLESTAAGLQRAGATVDFSSDPELDLSGYDVVHIFNSPRFAECLQFVANAKRQHKPIALSTIYWSKEELGVGVADSSKVRLAKKYLGIKVSIVLWRILKWPQRLKQGSNYRLERALFESADILLPNSEGEMREITRSYGVIGRHKAVRNAIDAQAFAKTPDLKREPFVLSVGRIESRKNALALIEACHDAKLHLVMIGGIEAGNAYNDLCLKKIAEYGFEYLGLMAPAQITDYYYRAQIHAMASWYETPGLSSMEAACGGCAIVSTDRGSTKEYFADMAFYCDPFSEVSITDALKQADEAKPSLKLREEIMREYTWDLAAQDTLKAYQELLK